MTNDQDCLKKIVLQSRNRRDLEFHTRHFLETADAGAFQVLSKELVQLLGYRTSFVSVVPPFLHIHAEAATDTGDVFKLRILGIWSRFTRFSSLESTLLQEFPPVLHIFDFRNQILFQIPGPARVWRERDILNLILAAWHSEFTLSDLLFLPPRLRFRRLRILSQTLGMPLERFVQTDRYWRILNAS